jgi:hypothetical protein
MIKSKLFIWVTLTEILIVSILYIYSLTVYQGSLRSELEAKRELVGELGLTDFAIWTEARYTRHPTQADLFSPFQDFPSAFEHFPAGSIIAPVMAFRKDTK